MTIEERLCFIRAGYSAQDIANFEAAENDPAPQPNDPILAPQPNDTTPTPAPQPNDPIPAPQPNDTTQTPVEQAPAWVTALNNTLDELRRTIQAGNVRFDDMGDDTDVIDSAEEALQQYLTGKAPEKIHGGKRK